MTAQDMSRIQIRKCDECRCSDQRLRSRHAGNNNTAMSYYRDKGVRMTPAFSALPLTTKRVQSNPIQSNAPTRRKHYIDAPTMMELAESLPYTSPTSSTRARPSRRYASLLGRIPGLSAFSQYQISVLVRPALLCPQQHPAAQQIDDNRAPAIFNILDHHSHQQMRTKSGSNTD
jgi:hypothetical protein